MKHIGSILKEHIEKNGLKKGDVATKAGITYNYLSTIFKQSSCDAALLEKLYVAVGLHPGIVFEVPDGISINTSEVYAKNFIGHASVSMGASDAMEALIEEKDKLIAEKERTIQLLLSQTNINQ